MSRRSDQIVPFSSIEMRRTSPPPSMKRSSSSSRRSPGRRNKSCMSGKGRSPSPGRVRNREESVTAYLQGSGLGANLGEMRLQLPTSSSSTSEAGGDKLRGWGTAANFGGGRGIPQKYHLHLHLISRLVPYLQWSPDCRAA